MGRELKLKFPKAAETDINGKIIEIEHIAGFQFLLLEQHQHETRKIPKFFMIIIMDKKKKHQILTGLKQVISNLNELDGSYFLSSIGKLLL